MTPTLADLVAGLPVSEDGTPENPFEPFTDDELDELFDALCAYRDSKPGDVTAQKLVVWCASERVARVS